MIKYSEMEKDFTIDCDGCGNFFPTSSKSSVYTVREVYRFCSERCQTFVLNRIELIKKNLEPKH